MAKILVLHGPNLNLLGQREPGVYGTTTLQALNDQLIDIAKQKKCALETFQSNAEHDLVNKIQAAKSDNVEFILINAAAFTHTSIAIRDALLSVGIPFYEVHISNVFQREAFRHHSYLADIAVGVISGFGPKGYELALEAAIERLSTK